VSALHVNTDFEAALMAEAMLGRRIQLQFRIMLAAIMAAFFFTNVNLKFCFCWASIYICLQCVEVKLFPRATMAAQLQSRRWRSVAVCLVIANNIVFGSFGAVEGLGGGVALGCAIFYFTGTAYNALLTSSRCPPLMWASVVPTMLGMLFIPIGSYLTEHSIPHLTLYLFAVCLYNALVLQARKLVKAFLDVETEGRRAAEAADAAKTRFVANTSHELRTPLNAVVASASVLARSPLSRRDQELVGLLMSGATTLQALISDILDASKAQAGKIELLAEPFDPIDVVRGTADLFRASAEAKGLSMVFEADDTDQWLFGDALRLGQIVANLCNNAIKFTAEGSVRLSARVAADEPGFAALTISVADTGIGMDAGTAARIFQPFAQADASTTRKFGGTGLGLSIAKTLVEQMNGTLNVESQRGVGSTFTLQVRLPLTEPPLELFELSAEPLHPCVAGRLRILVADDSPANRRLIAIMLDSLADVSEVENGRAMLDLIETQTFDLVISDVQMPIMDGPEAIKALRNWEATQGRDRLPVILATADAEMSLAKAQGLGAEAVLTKPFTVHSLFATVQPWLEPALNQAPVSQRAILEQQRR
jgi:signal transduction histidine kinase/ActR/RegA family two-component response regulator